jgi:hypothetical protein
MPGLIRARIGPARVMRQGQADGGRNRRTTRPSANARPARAELGRRPAATRKQAQRRTGGRWDSFGACGVRGWFVSSFGPQVVKNNQPTGTSVRPCGGTYLHRVCATFPPEQMVSTNQILVSCSEFRETPNLFPPGHLSGCGCTVHRGGAGAHKALDRADRRW